MQSLQDRLKQFQNPTGSEIWDILKSSEDALRQDLDSLRELATEKEQQNQKTLEKLEEKKKELGNIKNEMETLRKEYKGHIEMVESSLKANGLEMKQVVEVFEKVLQDSLSEKKEEILELLVSDTPRPEIVAKLLKILAEPAGDQVRSMLSTEILEFCTESVESFRRDVWNLLQKQGIPLKPLEDTQNPSVFLGKLDALCEYACNLDKLHHGNHQNSVSLIISTSFGQLVNICVDMIENEKGDADFEWILTCGHKWAKNLKKILEKVMEKLKIEEKHKHLAGNQFNESFVALIHTITRKFLSKNLKDPLIFSKFSQLFRKFEDTCDEFDLTGKDLFKPFYEPEIMSKWIMLEVEMFTICANQLFSSATCFDPLTAISIGSESSIWASEVTIFFEEWLARVDKDISSLGDFDAQLAFYEAVQLLILDVCSRIHVAANVLYLASSWSNDVYLVMNTLWEIRRMAEKLTITWPIPSFEIQNSLEKEWNRLGGMISEYLGDIVDSMDKTVVSTYCSGFEKQKIVNDTFYHVIKCLRNVTRKASKPSRSALLNVLLTELFANLQKKFDKWKAYCSVEILVPFYFQIYTCLLPYLDQLHNSSIWIREDASRSEICRLDALMKTTANRDPSGELVRTAFRSIDEEMVIKMLSELGIYSTSDHAFQDYQILAENWEKIRDKGYGY